MGKRFRSCDLNQAYLLPPSLQDWLPEGHLGRFVAEVVEALDLAAIYAKYEAGDGRGLSAYDPRMMVRVLIYGYCRGVASSRRIERATYEDVAFRYLAADQHPDHDTIAAFRQEQLTPWAQLFVQVLQLCQRAGGAFRRGAVTPVSIGVRSGAVRTWAGGHPSRPEAFQHFGGAGRNAAPAGLRHRAGTE